MKPIAFAVLFFICQTQTAVAALFTVGSSIDCTHTSIQAAFTSASANATPDNIRLSNQLTYTAQAITIGAGDVTLTGGFTSCSTATPTGSTTISGLGGAADSVFKISGDGVRYFNRLLITRGDALGTDGRGGGIRFDGTGDLILEDVSIDQNAALSGGGIYFRSTGGAATLLINSNSSVSRNVATMPDGHGGGITVTGNARLVMTGNNTSIFSNAATGANSRGGGLAVFGPARADIGSPGLGPFGAIDDNEADFGGGMAADASLNTTRIRIFTTVANRPVRIHGNRARSLGGAGFARPRSDGHEFRAGICLLDARIDGNSAPNGAALYLDVDYDEIGLSPFGGSLSINPDADNFACDAPESAGALGAVRCTPNVAGCNVIENNRAINIGSGTPTTGAIILAQTDSESILRRISFLNNTGGSVIDLREPMSFDLGLGLIAGNTTTGNLIEANSGTQSLRIVNTTISSNSIGGNRVIRRTGGGELILKNNLINQPALFTLSYGGNVSNPSADIAFNVSTDVTTMPPNSFNVTGAIRLTDPARGDYRQRIASRGVDTLPIIAGNDLDLDRRPFDVFNPIYSALSTPANGRDAGAFERQLSDPWLINGEFDGDLNRWNGDNPGLTSYSTLNAPGSSGGSLAFSRAPSVGATTPRFNAGVQCFNVPAPGRYSLTAQGRAPGNIFLARNRPVIRWRLRSSSANCAQANPIAAEGDLYLSNAAAFSAPIAPAQITVTPALWSANATIEVRLDVEPAALDGSIDAGFDRIEMTSVENDVLFANGFE